MATPTWLKPKFSDLEDCIRIAEKVSMNFGGSCSEEEFAKLTDISLSSSYFNLQLNSMRAYGLLDYKDGKITLTSVGEKITTPTDAEERSVALLAAISHFSPFKALVDRYKGKATIPEKQFIENSLVAGGKKEDASKWADVFLRSSKYAGVFKSGQVFSEIFNEKIVPQSPAPQKQPIAENFHGGDEARQGWLTYPVPTPSGMAKIIVPEKLSRQAWEKLKKLLDAIEPEKTNDHEGPS